MHSGSDDSSPGPYFRVYIAQNGGDDLLPHRFDGPSSLRPQDPERHGKNAAVDESTLQRGNYQYIRLNKRSEVDHLKANSVVLRQMIGDAEAERIGYIVLHPTPYMRIDAPVLQFMVESLARNQARFEGTVLLGHLVPLTNALWKYKVLPPIFLDGWHRLYSKSKLQSTVPEGDWRCWYDSPANISGGSCMDLLSVTWVLGHRVGEMEANFACSIITAVWNSDQQIETPISDLRHIKGTLS
jgi:hypothetical protein